MNVESGRAPYMLVPGEYTYFPDFKSKQLYLNTSQMLSNFGCTSSYARSDLAGASQPRISERTVSHPVGDLVSNLFVKAAPIISFIRLKINQSREYYFYFKN